jgi:hypothetical protein
MYATMMSKHEQRSLLRCERCSSGKNEPSTSDVRLVGWSLFENRTRAGKARLLATDLSQSGEDGGSLASIVAFALCLPLHISTARFIWSVVHFRWHFQNRFGLRILDAQRQGSGAIVTAPPWVASRVSRVFRPISRRSTGSSA